MTRDLNPYIIIIVEHSPLGLISLQQTRCIGIWVTTLSISCFRGGGGALPLSPGPNPSAVYFGQPFKLPFETFFFALRVYHVG
jgi:hypothetical protein